MASAQAARLSAERGLQIRFLTHRPFARTERKRTDVVFTAPGNRDVLIAIKQIIEDEFVRPRRSGQELFSRHRVKADAAKLRLVQSEEASGDRLKLGLFVHRVNHRIRVVDGEAFRSGEGAGPEHERRRSGSPIK